MILMEVKPMEAIWKSEKHKAESLTHLIHEAVRLLKMDAKTVIPIGKFTEEEVRLAMWAYALHKGKWFDSTYDKTSRVFHVQRSTPLPEREIEEEFSEEEEE